MAGLDITQNDLDSLPDRIARATRRAHELTAQEVWGNIRENAPQDHGRLAGSFRLTTNGAMSTIASNVVYAAVHEEGREPRDLFPVNGRALRFVMNGQVIYATHVWHPGIPATHYISNSIEQAQSRIPDFVAQALAAEGLA